MDKCVNRQLLSTHYLLTSVVLGLVYAESYVASCLVVIVPQRADCTVFVVIPEALQQAG